MLWAPPALGYGVEGAGPIPPGAVLVLMLVLFAVLSDETSVGKA